MSQKTPRLYLTEKMCETAVKTALVAVTGPASPIQSLLDQPVHLHIVILATAMKGIHGLPIFGEDDLFRPFPVYNFGIGKEDWELPHYEIASNQAMRIWENRYNDPILLPKNIDVSSWGGANNQGVIVSCSGPKHHFSKLIAEISANTIIALVHNAYGTSPENKESILFQFIG